MKTRNKNNLLLGILLFALPFYPLCHDQPDIDVQTATWCFGTEPFWDLIIKDGNIKFFSFNELTMETDGAKARAPIGGPSNLVMYQGKLKNTNGYINVLAKVEHCSDHMSERDYPVFVFVLSGNTLYTGCCDTPESLKRHGVYRDPKE